MLYSCLTNEQAITLKLERALLLKLQKWKIRNTIRPLPSVS